MITMKDFMELVDYKITEGSSYGWSCYGPNAYSLDSWNRIEDEGGFSFNITFDTTTQEVYEVNACDFTNDRAYRMINPNYIQKHADEAKARGCHKYQAWDNVDYVDLEVDDDFYDKCIAIESGENYDTRVSVPVEFSDEDMLRYMKLAHERDITFNQLIEESLREIIDSHDRDPHAFMENHKRIQKDER
jgi:hypothetical protein